MNEAFDGFDGVKALAPGHPVFLLGAADKSYLVVKQENAVGAKVNLNANLKAMSAATGKAAGKALVQGELDAIRDFLQDSQDALRLWRIPEPLGVVALRNAFIIPGTWYKMPEAPGVTDLKAAVADLINNQDKTGVRAIAKSLNAAGGMEMLGRIIAVDLYNGNTDRFVADGLGGALNPRTNIRFRVMQNIGNVLLSIENGKLKPVGLDSFEAASIYADVTKTIQAIELTDAGMAPGWSGRKLTDAQAAWRLQFAQSICDDLEDAWGLRNRKLSILRKKRLNSDAAARLAKGMRDAIIELKNHVRLRAAKINAPAGLASRLAILEGR
jgi:hypothetical protein